MSRKITMGISNPLSNIAGAIPGAAAISNTVHNLKMNYNPVTGASNTTSGSPTTPYVDPADIVANVPTTRKEGEEGLIKSRSTLEARRDAAFDKDPNSAKTARLNRRYSSYKEGTERRANEINKKDPQTGIGRAIKGVFGKNNFTNSAGEQVSRKEAVEERQQQELRKLGLPNKGKPIQSSVQSSSVVNKPSSILSGGANKLLPMPGLSTSQNQSLVQAQIGSATSNCGLNKTYNPVTKKCE